MKISRDFTFDSCHHIPGHKGKCKNWHGHTYKLRVTLEGPINGMGMLMDFGDLKEIVNKEIIELYDHKNLNEFFVNPTAELMAQEIFNKLSKLLPLHAVRLYETPNSFAEASL